MENSSIISAFQGIVGKAYVLWEDEKLNTYKNSCIPETRSIQLALLPETVQQVQEIVNLAGLFKLPLYPISTGKNWGYGSANPVRDNNVILDLSRMQQIEVNKELAYAVIGPGVTQQQLFEHLNKNKTGLMMDPTGSGPYCSVLGNTLERGYGISPYGNHFASLCGMEIVLPDGEVLKTGFGRYPQAKATHIFPYGMGPYLDGIFTQSNLGIVTKIAVWLMPVPEHFEACYFFSENEDDIGPLVEAARWLLLHGVVRGAINLVHRNRSLTMLSQYPWEQMGGRVPVHESVWRVMAKEKNIGAWNGVTGLYGTREEVRAAKKAIRKKLAGHVTRLYFLSDSLLALLEKYKKAAGMIMRMNITELFKVLKPSYELLKGKPCEVSLPTPYWRMKKNIPLQHINPARDNCGIYWLAPIVPMTHVCATDFINMIQAIFEKHGFEACITFTTVTPRCFDCTLPILYNKEDAEETKRAKKCYEEAFAVCMSEGYIPYRVGIQSMATVAGENDEFWKVVKKLKKTFDPQGILSPGRYGR